MKKIDSHECKVQVLVCTNKRDNGKPSCKDFGGQEFYQRLKDSVKDAGIRDTHWVSRTGCLGFCNSVGTTVTITHVGKNSEWLSEVTADDFEQVWKKITA